MPVYQWHAIASDEFRWLRERARRNADLYDGYRVDHVVGFYRTYARPRDAEEPFFTPADQPEQEALGEPVLAILREGGAKIIAEDLGTVPDFVRTSLARLGVPGFRVFRWERDWHTEGNRSAIHRSTRRFQWRPLPRTTPSRLSCGGRARRPTSAGT